MMRSLRTTPIARNLLCAVTLSATLIGGTLHAQTRWERITNVPDGPALNAVQFVGAGTAVAIGDGGRILRSTDDGISWQAIASDNSRHLYGLSFGTEVTGNAVGADGVALRTTDGGVTWTRQQTGVSQRLNSVFFRDANHGIIAEPVLSTSDGGTAWRQVVIGEEFGAADCWMLDADTLLRAGLGGVAAAGAIERSTDAGVSWDWTPITPMPPVDTSMFIRPLNALFFMDRDTGIAVGEGEMIVRTTDAGASWRVVFINTNKDNRPKNLLDVAFSDMNNGVAVGVYGTILATTDGGYTWTRQESGTTDTLHGVWFSGSGHAVVVGGGSEGLVLRSSAGPAGVEVARPGSHGAMDLSGLPNPVGELLPAATRQ